MKRVLYTFIFSLLIIASATSQSSDTKKADKYFNELSYIRAAEAYQIAVEKDSSVYVLQRLADSYYFNSKMEEASQWYGKLFELYKSSEIKSEYLFKYAQALRGIGKFKESNRWMKKFRNQSKEDVRAQNFSNDEISVKDLKSENSPFTIKNVEGINTPRQDYGVSFNGEDIVFASVKEEGNFIKIKHGWNNKGFLDLFSASVDDDGNISEISPIKELNSIYHESSVAFSPDQKTVYFTRNNYTQKKLRRDKKGIANLKIYSAEFIDGKWRNITELPFNSDEYSVGHPALSEDGSKLFFVSDMSGSFGQTDIFYVKVNADKTFGPIQTLGIHVNTEGREMFPYVVGNKLYFSSDGHFGLGGLDVFVSEENNGEFQPPVNLKSPVNTISDDFAFVINPTTNKGYLSSNREGGKGDDDIYSFVFEEKEVVVEKKECKQEVSGVVVDKKFGVPLKNAKIVLTHEDGTIVSELITGVSGKFSYFLACDETYKITASKKYYKSDSNTFKTTAAMSLELDLDFDLGIIDEFTYNDRDELMIRINPIFFDYNKSTIRSDAAKELDQIATVMKRFPELIIESTSHTDARGRSSYNESLSDRRAKSTVRYIVSRGISDKKISGKGYGESKLTNGCVDNDAHTNRVKCTKEEHQANRRSEFIITNVNELGIANKVVQSSMPIEQKEETKNDVKTHQVKEGETLFSIARLYKTSVNQLRKLNSLTSNSISVGQVLKLK